MTTFANDGLDTTDVSDVSDLASALSCSLPSMAALGSPAIQHHGLRQRPSDPAAAPTLRYPLFEPHEGAPICMVLTDDSGRQRALTLLSNAIKKKRK